jgi:hypothetical protein
VIKHHEYDHINSKIGPDVIMPEPTVRNIMITAGEIKEKGKDASAFLWFANIYMEQKCYHDRNRVSLTVSIAIKNAFSLREHPLSQKL